MNEKLLEMRIGVVIWDIIENEIDKRCPEVLDMSPQERENIYGSCVRGVAEMILEDILNNIEKWLPDFQSAAGSQNVDTELLVDGYNDALTKIKSKLRNKK